MNEFVALTGERDEADWTLTEEMDAWDHARSEEHVEN